MEEKQRLQNIIDSKLSIEYAMAKLRQETEDNEVAIGVLQSGADTLARKCQMLMILLKWKPK